LHLAPQGTLDLCVPNSFNELPRLNAESTRYFYEIIETDVTFAALDSANIGCVEPCSISKFLLRPFSRKAKSPNCLPELDSFPAHAGLKITGKDDESTDDQYCLMRTDIGGCEPAEVGHSL
jgi:hypothetical protein